MAQRSGSRLAATLLAILPHLAIFVAILILWEVAVAMKWINDFLIPRPTAVFVSIKELYVTKGTIYRHFWITSVETAIGFALAAAIGISLAVASALNETFRRYIAPYAVVLNVTPALALSPILIAWFGFGLGSKVALATLISLFPIFVNTLAGLTQQDAEREELFRSLGASPMQRFWKMQVPAALPLTFAGLKIGITLALIGSVVAEFEQAVEGVGVLMQRFSYRLDMASAITVLLTMSAMGLTLYTAMEILDERLVFWRREKGMARVSARRRAAFDEPDLIADTTTKRTTT